MLLIFVSLFAAFLALKKKESRCFTVCILACLYSIMHLVYRTPQLANTLLYDVLSVASLPFLMAMLIATVWVFRKPLENDKHYILPIIFCAGVFLDKVIRKIFFHIQAEQAKEIGADGYEIFQKVSRGSTILDIIYYLFFGGMVVSVICILNSTKRERDS